MNSEHYRGLVVTREHMRTVPGFKARAGYCASGGRAWFARHGLCWSQFLHEGVAAEVMHATGDPLAVALVEHAAAVQGWQGGEVSQ
ncbi:hypothetical protein [Stenotrophomonas sp. PS02298]|uniref:hypothetical protein n=1 Tax=Stenotrophomonas sp. PS02298 TaxID=2991424 RepID=UPI00249A3DA2|nr:hypothetical protein [Stenotrophomonas sp. PS02298]